MDNHLHLVLRNRPDIVETWTDREVARRYCFICPSTRNKDGSAKEPLPCEIDRVMQDKGSEKLRQSVSSISLFMQLITQPIAQRANKEDDVRGHFFADRFKSDRLETEEDVLSCSLYVNLNAVRAGVVDTPENSEYTSAFERIQARWQEHDAAMRAQDGESTDEECVERRDAWLSPVFLDESADAYTETPQAQSQGPGEPSNVCNAAGAARISNKGYLSISFEAYLQLMDLVGRMIRPDKRGSIPKELPPILARLQLDLDHLVERVQHAFLSKNAACRFG